MLTIEEICKWADTSIKSSNFTEGERILKAQHVIYCRKKMSNSEIIDIFAKCLSAVRISDKDFIYDLRGQVFITGDIKTLNCSCRAGQGEKCKNVLAALLRCYR